MSSPVRLSRRGSVAIVTIDNPPVNAIGPEIVGALGARVEEAMADPGIRAVVIVGEGRNFVAGYDINEFVRIASGQKKPDVSLGAVLDKIENSPKPVVAAIRGAALGGGLELALACHYRVAAEGAQLGQPEVKLGLIPGAGGTQRLPRLIGSFSAAMMCAVGDPVSSHEAKEAGLVDEIIAGGLLDGAVAFASQLTAPRRTRDRNESLSTFILPKLPEKLTHLLAPNHALAAVELANRLPFEAGLAEEARLFRECLFSNESKALIHIFLGEREVAKVPGVPRMPPPAAPVAVIGAGTMGRGISMAYANAGIPVLLSDSSSESLDRTMLAIRGQYKSNVAKGRMTPDEANERVSKIRPVHGYEGMENAGIIVEAVFEDLALKKRVFADIDSFAGPEAILATNTSSLNIDEIASTTRRPERVVGHHFFSPAHVMRLLEIVRGKATSPEVLGASLALAKLLGKIGVVVGNCKGFVGNRMFHCYRREAQFLVEEGARPSEVDSALTGFGMAMGPLAVGDLAGLDVGWRIRKEHAHLDPPGVRKPLIEDRLCEAGRFGQKTQAGWYRYDSNRARADDPEVDALAAAVAREAGIVRREITADEIRSRCLYALVNEGCRILDEGIAARPLDIDIVYVHGYGFPAFRGGPMKFAELTGWKVVYERVLEFEHRLGSLWTPARLLATLASGSMR
jgi:3-hydroxyacyl-CoA dehydrogenase